MTVPDDIPIGRCSYTWTLKDPNPEDRANGTTHRCLLDDDHPEEIAHTCSCGEKA